MLCFNWTVGSPRSVPVLSRLLNAGRSERARGRVAQLKPSTGRSRRWSGLDLAISPSPCRSQARFGLPPARPSPSSQSFSRSYGSNLPTSLTYIVLQLEAVHLGDLLRISVRSGTKFTPSPQAFQGPDASAPDPAGSAVLYGNKAPLPGQADSRAYVPYKEKRTLPGTCADVSWFVCVAALDPEGPISVLGSGNINPVPFG